MKILFITIGFAPYTFSESLCNSKLVLAMMEKGWHVDVISRIDNGTNYSTEWSEPWILLKDITHQIKYPLGNKFTRTIDVLKSAMKMNGFLFEGIRWCAHAYDYAFELCKKNSYDVIITRSPSDIPHIIGYKLSKRTGIKWISNWNDPAATIWPEPYTHHFSNRRRKRLRKYEKMCLQESDAVTFPATTLENLFKQEYPFLNNKLCKEIPHIALIEKLLPTRHIKEKNHIFSLCHSGNLSIERNPENTFKAIKELIDENGIHIKLDIMGYANEFTTKLITKYQLENIVHFTGSYSYIDAINILQNYDVLVLIEAIMDYGVFFPSKLVDYIQSGNPILAISPKEGYVSEVIHKFGGGIAIDNTQYKEIKKAIKLMYNKWLNGNLHEEYNSIHLNKHYSSDVVIDKYVNLFHELNIIQ